MPPPDFSLYISMVSNLNIATTSILRITTTYFSPKRPLVQFSDLKNTTTRKLTGVYTATNLATLVLPLNIQHAINHYTVFFDTRCIMSVDTRCITRVTSYCRGGLSTRLVGVKQLIGCC